MFFAVYDRTLGHALWESDGTARGTVFVKVVVERPDYKPYFYLWLTIAGDHLYFRGYDPVHGFELWLSDGTASGTAMVKDFYPDCRATHPPWLTDLDGVLYFTATDPTSGTELWRSDGSTSGTTLVKDIWPAAGSTRISGIAVIGNARLLGQRWRSRQGAMDQ